ncbi:hypothetical protein MIR68_008959 [Amoeboaphelidium protococcarum]|nr:hypothetical protein MIR68_008959 [Amoeboaphelidium protococcarum]
MATTTTNNEDFGKQIVEKTTKFTVPVTTQPGLTLVLGILNLVFFGIGTIIAGVVNNSLADVVIGILQLLIPFVGWVWSVIWGVLMIGSAATSMKK